MQCSETGKYAKQHTDHDVDNGGGGETSTETTVLNKKLLLFSRRDLLGNVKFAHP